MLAANGEPRPRTRRRRHRVPGGSPARDRRGHPPGRDPGADRSTPYCWSGRATPSTAPPPGTSGSASTRRWPASTAPPGALIRIGDLRTGPALGLCASGRVSTGCSPRSPTPSSPPSACGPTRSSVLDPAFSIVVVLGGAGTLAAEHGDTGRGACRPHAASPVRRRCLHADRRHHRDPMPPAVRAWRVTANM